MPTVLGVAMLCCWQQICMHTSLAGSAEQQLQHDALPQNNLLACKQRIAAGLQTAVCSLSLMHLLLMEMP
jgi:hypothetical protein